MGRAADILRARFGADFYERENPLITQAGVTAARVVSDNGDRVGLHIINLSPNTIYVGLGPDVAAARSIQHLAPNGGFVSLSIDEDFSLTTRELYVLATAAASDIRAVELIAR